jgi:hypothetical protein
MQDNCKKTDFNHKIKRKVHYHGTRRGWASSAFNKPRPPPFKRVGLWDEATYKGISNMDFVFPKEIKYIPSVHQMVVLNRDFQNS